MNDASRFNENLISRLMGMDDNTWMRHANPWSVWTRAITGLPAILLPLWSIHWIGWWAVIPIAIGIAWIWLNPRIFGIPAHTDNWGSKVTFGERVWMNRNNIEVPGHHSRWAFILSTAGGTSFILALVGIYFQNISLTVAGALVSWLTKMWFCDRMVWLFEDMKDHDPEYAGWLR